MKAQGYDGNNLFLESWKNNLVNLKNFCHCKTDFRAVICVIFFQVLVSDQYFYAISTFLSFHYKNAMSGAFSLTLEMIMLSY